MQSVEELITELRGLAEKDSRYAVPVMPNELRLICDELQAARAALKWILKISNSENVEEWHHLLHVDIREAARQALVGARVRRVTEGGRASEHTNRK